MNLTPYQRLDKRIKRLERVTDRLVAVVFILILMVILAIR